MLKNMIAIKTASFHVNSEPKAERIPSLTAARGIAPSSTPCGQIYLQKNGNIVGQPIVGAITSPEQAAKLNKLIDTAIANSK